MAGVRGWPGSPAGLRELDWGDVACPARAASSAARSSADGSAELEAQLNIMNIRSARLVAGSDERVALAGDQLFIRELKALAAYDWIEPKP